MPDLSAVLISCGIVYPNNNTPTWVSPDSWNCKFNSERVWPKPQDDIDFKSEIFVKEEETTEGEEIYALSVDRYRLDQSDDDIFTLDEVSFTFNDLNSLKNKNTILVLEFTNNSGTTNKSLDMLDLTETSISIKNNNVIISSRVPYIETNNTNIIYYILPADITGPLTITATCTDKNLNFKNIRIDSTGVGTAIKNILGGISDGEIAKDPSKNNNAYVVSQIYDCLQEIIDYIESNEKTDKLFSELENYLIKLEITKLDDIYKYYKKYKQAVEDLYGKYNGSVIEEAEPMKIITSFLNQNSETNISLYDFDFIRGHLTRDDKIKVSLQQIGDVAYLVCNGIYFGGSVPPYFEKTNNDKRPQPGIKCTLWIPGSIENLYGALSNSTNENDHYKLKKEENGSYTINSGTKNPYTIIYKPTE